MTARTYTPKEFSTALEAELGIHLSAAWVRAECALYVSTKGRRGRVPVVFGSRPYLIPGTALERFQKPLVFAARVA